MNGKTRRGFLKTAGLALLAIGPLAGAWGLWSRVPSRPAARTGARIRIRPVDPKRCAPSFRAYCERASFATAADAVRVAARTRYPFLIYHV